VRVYQFRHIRGRSERRYRTLAARRAPAGAPPQPRRLRESRSGHLLASERRNPAAIVQGTRTPPSHGGNPGSNPGSGTFHGPEKSGPLAFRGARRDRRRNGSRTARCRVDSRRSLYKLAFRGQEGWLAREGWHVQGGRSRTSTRPRGGRHSRGDLRHAHPNLRAAGQSTSGSGMRRERAKASMRRSA
jgi:hypothetical protein